MSQHTAAAPAKIDRADPLEDLRVEVRQHDMATRALTSGDRLAHPADPDHDHDVVDHVCPPVRSSHNLGPC